MAFVLLAALLAFYGGLRPPLHHDLKSVEVPFGASTDLESSPEALLDGRRQFRLQSPGGVLLVFLGVMALIVLRRPQHLAVMAGGLLVASFVLGADLCLNHPRLVELIDSEREERRQIVDTLRGLDETSVVQARGPDSGAALAPSPLLIGATHLSYWHWLIPLSILGVLFGNQKASGRPLRRLAIWAFVAVGLASIVVGDRVRAEYHWNRAAQLELSGDIPRARQALDRSVEVFPELGQLQRTWLLSGKLDFHAGRSTPQERLFRAHQQADAKNFRHAEALVEALVLEVDSPVLRREAGRIFTLKGMAHYRRGELGAAENSWHKASALCPGRVDYPFYLGIVQASMDPSALGSVEKKFRQTLNRLADRALKADILASLADAYFDAGRMVEARACYMESLRTFALPKNSNYRAMKGLSGT